MLTTTKRIARSILPPAVTEFLRFVWVAGERDAALRFLSDRTLPVKRWDRCVMLWQFCLISARVRCAHEQAEMLQVVTEILRLPGSESGVIVEAGCYKGGSTAKLSLAAALVGRELVVFDSFEGLPTNTEAHGTTIFGEVPRFVPGAYRGALEEVSANVRRYGRIHAVRFIKGWFDRTLPTFSEPVATGYIDVDLVASTRTCLQHLFPLLRRGGCIYSQDGHLPLIIELLSDHSFWQNDLGIARPHLAGIGTAKLVCIRKDPATFAPGN